MIRVGLIGGGQLARMMIQKASKLGLSFTVLDPSADCPAAPLADTFVQGSLRDEASLRSLVSQCDVSTYDIEHIDTACLHTLKGEGHAIYPSPETLETVQDKWHQREFLRSFGLPQPRYVNIDTPNEDALSQFGFPLVQKARRGGYDGKGVVRLDRPKDCSKALSGPSIIEGLVSIDKELSVIVARDIHGKTRCYPPVEMVFDPEQNILNFLIAPAAIDADIADQAQQIATAAANALSVTGILAVELFLSTNGTLFINEVAPRPHNSGHHTFESCMTCQFEQHIRAVAGLPLGDTSLLSPCSMVNILGEGSGPTVVHGLEDALAIPGVAVHLYGKSECRPGRKMGHITALDHSADTASQTARMARRKLQVVGSASQQRSVNRRHDHSAGGNDG